MLTSHKANQSNNSEIERLLTIKQVYHTTWHLLYDDLQKIFFQVLVTGEPSLFFLNNYMCLCYISERNLFWFQVTYIHLLPVKEQNLYAFFAGSKEENSIGSQELLELQSRTTSGFCLQLYLCVTASHFFSLRILTLSNDGTVVNINNGKGRNRINNQIFLLLFRRCVKLLI